MSELKITLDGARLTAHWNIYFRIDITEESDVSLDGGYTFEDTTNAVSLDLAEAEALSGALQEFIKGLRV